MLDSFFYDPTEEDDEFDGVNFDDDEEFDDDEFDEEDDFFDDIDWDPTEYKIKSWLEETLDANFHGWSEIDLTAGGTPEFATEGAIDKVLDTIPHGFLGLKNPSSYLISGSNGEALVLFDDKPKGTAITDEEYKNGIESKIAEIEEILGDEFVRAVKIVDENNATRLAWIASSDGDDDFEDEFYDDDEEFDEDDDD